MRCKIDCEPLFSYTLYARTKQLTEFKGKTNIIVELTHGEAERRQADDECMKKHDKHLWVNMGC